MESVDEILEKWNMSELITVFQENSINLEAFNELTEDVIKELIPKVGPRVLFNKKYGEYKTFVLKTVESDTTITNSPSSSACSLNTIGSVLSPTSSDAEELPLSFNPWPDAIVGLTEEEIQNTPGAKHRKAIYINSEKQIDLKNKLLNTQKGKLILSFYENNHTLSDNMRDKLTEIVIECEVANDVDKRISTERFNLLANAIVAVFPTEIKELYFATAYKRKIDGFCQKVGCGKLFRKYYNVRRKMRETGLLVPVKRQQNDIDENSGCSSTEIDNESINWLKNSIEPWTLVIDRWIQTYGSRASWRSKPISEYFSAFPALKLRLGYTLLQKDFYATYPELETKIFANFTEFSKKIIKYARTLCTKVIKDYMEIFTSELNEEAYTVYTFFLLPLLIKPVVVKRQDKNAKENKFWKPSTAEITEGFIVHVKVVGEIKPALERKRNKLLKYGLTLQPTPIFVGPTLNSIKACYVSIDEILYEVPTPLKAIDVTFGIVHALNAEYPKEAEQVWLLIQKGLYELDNKFDTKYLTVEKIIKTIETY